MPIGRSIIKLFQVGTRAFAHHVVDRVMKWLGEELMHATTQPNKDRTKQGQGIVVPPTVALAYKEWCGAMRQESLVDWKR
jgi:hypothetical protein